MFKKKRKTAANAADTKAEKNAVENPDVIVLKASECLPNPWRVDRLPIQRLTDKLAHDNALPVCTDVFDEKTKSAHYIVAVNAHDTKPVCFSYDEICKNFGWDSFSVTRDKQAIKPHWTEPTAK